MPAAIAVQVRVMVRVMVRVRVTVRLRVTGEWGEDSRYGQAED